MDIYVKEYAWMWQRLGLSLAECRVYAYIYGLTTSTKAKQKGYKGSVRALAQMLGIDAGGTSRILIDFINRGLIQLTDGIYTSVESVHASVESVHTSVESVHTGVESVHTNVESVHSPVPPIKEINKEMENKEKQQCARAHACEQQGGVFMMFSFEAFKSAFCRADGDSSELQRRETACVNEWQAMSEAKRQAIIRMRRLRADGVDADHWKPNPLFLLRDFPEPQPTNYNGRSFPTGAQMVIAIYNGTGGVYTKADAELYNMTIKKEIEP